jgi:hypothetical protein
MTKSLAVHKWCHPEALEGPKAQNENSSIKIVQGMFKKLRFYRLMAVLSKPSRTKIAY